MKAVVQVSEVLETLIQELLIQEDPDYPLIHGQPLPLAVDRTLQALLIQARAGYHSLDPTLPPSWVRRVRRDPDLWFILPLPWRAAQVIDLRGTVVFKF